MSRPLIGVTAWPRPVDGSLGAARPTYTLGVEYADPLTAAGAGVVLLSPTADPDVLLDRLDGIVLSGGDDVDPRHYGGEPDPDHRYEASRDDFELALAHAARRRRTPTLAICRGMQILTIACGGTLVGDLPHTEHHHPISDPAGQLAARHPVTLEPDSALARVYGRTERVVNTIHHQAVARLAPGFRAVAHAPDGVIEAIEPLEAWPLWAVQWHPEKLTDPPEAAEERPLFDALLTAAHAEAARR